MDTVEQIAARILAGIEAKSEASEREPRWQLAHEVGVLRAELEMALKVVPKRYLAGLAERYPQPEPATV